MASEILIAFGGGVITTLCGVVVFLYNELRTVRAELRTEQKEHLKAVEDSHDEQIQTYEKVTEMVGKLGTVAEVIQKTGRRP